jgi:phosphoglycolate phosphatase
MTRRYELVILDWDGTLMDSAAKIVRCFRAAAADVGVPDPGETAVRNIIGLALDEAMQALLPDENEAMRQRLVSRYRDYFLGLDRTESPLFPGVAGGLRDLANAGYLLAIATGKARRGLERVLGETDLAPLFAASRCADEAFSKPHPQMLHDILEQTGVVTERAIMVGDTVYDLEMARNAGMDSLGVSYGVHERARLLEQAPRGIMDSFEEVCAWLAIPDTAAGRRTRVGA